jgi:uncharacterized protein YbaR (Trm112 family)
MSLLDPELLKILCCPETHQPVSEAAATLVTDLNKRIASGLVKNRAGKAIVEKLDGALLRQDRQWIYPIRHRIPIMLIEEAIPLS